MTQQIDYVKYLSGLGESITDFIPLTTSENDRFPGTLPSGFNATTMSKNELQRRDSHSSRISSEPTATPTTTVEVSYPTSPFTEELLGTFLTSGSTRKLSNPILTELTNTSHFRADNFLDISVVASGSDTKPIASQSITMVGSQRYLPPQVVALSSGESVNAFFTHKGDTFAVVGTDTSKKIWRLEFSPSSQAIEQESFTPIATGRVLSAVRIRSVVYLFVKGGKIVSLDLATNQQNIIFTNTNISGISYSPLYGLVITVNASYFYSYSEGGTVALEPILSASGAFIQKHTHYKGRDYFGIISSGKVMVVADVLGKKWETIVEDVVGHILYGFYVSGSSLFVAFDKSGYGGILSLVPISCESGTSLFSTITVTLPQTIINATSYITGMSPFVIISDESKAIAIDTTTSQTTLLSNISQKGVALQGNLYFPSVLSNLSMVQIRSTDRAIAKTWSMVVFKPGADLFVMGESDVKSVDMNALDSSGICTTYSYLPTAIEIGALELSETLENQQVEITIPYTEDIAEIYSMRNGFYKDYLVRIILGDRPMYTGYIGAVKFDGIVLTVTVLHKLSKLGRKVDISTSPTCIWTLGDAQCGVTVPKIATQVTATDGIGYITVTASLPNMIRGTVSFTSGKNRGFKTLVIGTEGVKLILLNRPPFTISTFNQVELEAGCDRTHTTCRTVWNNFDNFGGFPFLPGNDMILSSMYNQ